MNINNFKSKTAACIFLALFLVMSFYLYSYEDLEELAVTSALILDF